LGNEELNTIQNPSDTLSLELDTSIRLDRQTVSPFLIVGLAWYVASAFLCFQFRHVGEPLWPVLKPMSMLWALCLFDLYCLARAVGAAIGFTSAQGEKRSALKIQASYWGFIKLACLGILGAILLGDRSIPAIGLLTGSATLVVVPLLGGYWWSQKVLHHA
jgi:hypothetical protein